MEELLGVVRLRGDVRALAELEHGLEHGSPCRRPGTGDDEAVVLRDAERLGVELAEDLVRRARSTSSPLERAPGCDGARVARRVAVALLDLRRRDDDVVDAPSRARCPPCR